MQRCQSWRLASTGTRVSTQMVCSTTIRMHTGNARSIGVTEPGGTSAAFDFTTKGTAPQLQFLKQPPQTLLHKSCVVKVEAYNVEAS